MWGGGSSLGGATDLTADPRLQVLELAWPSLNTVRAKAHGTEVAVNVSSEWRVSSKWERNSSLGAIQHRLALGYGEVVPKSALEMLNEIRASPGQVFYDLGSGDGKVAGVAWALGLRSTGVELVADRWATSCEATRRLWRTPARYSQMRAAGTLLRFVQGSILDYSFCDADVVYAAATLFPRWLIRKVGKAARCLKKGATVVLLGSAAGKGRDLRYRHERLFPEEHFAIVKTVTTDASWSYDGGTVAVVQRKTSTPSEEDLAAGRALVQPADAPAGTLCELRCDGPAAACSRRPEAPEPEEGAVEGPQGGAGGRGRGGRGGRGGRRRSEL